MRADSHNRVDADASIKLVKSKPQEKKIIENFSFTSLDIGIFHQGTRKFINNKMFAFSVVLIFLLMIFIAN
jgi:hypothetical protein